MKKNDRYRAEVAGFTSEGLGVCRVDGCAVFVPNAAPGEEYLLRITHVGKTAAHGKLLRVEAASPHRIEPDCPYFPACGGCDFRHADYALETELKHQRVLDALNRIGGCGLENLEITGAAEQDGYRNKVQYPVQEQNGRAEAGFFSAGTHRVIPIAHCRIQPDCADAIRAEVLRWMAQYKIRAYDEKTGCGYIRHNELYRQTFDLQGKLLAETPVAVNDAVMMYSPYLEESKKEG